MDLSVKESLKMTCIYVETCSLWYNTIKYLCLSYHCSTSLVLSKRNVMYSIKSSVWRDAFDTINTCLESNPDIVSLFVHCNLWRHIEGHVKFKCRNVGNFFSQTFIAAKSGWRYIGAWLHVHNTYRKHTHNAIKIFFIHFMNFDLFYKFQWIKIPSVQEDAL